MTTTNPAIPLPEEQFEERPNSPLRQAFRRLIRKKVAVIAMIVIGALYTIGIFSPLIATHDPNSIDLRATQEGPSSEHLFGTDRAGRDLFSRAVYGIRTTVIITVISLTTGSLILGVTLGLLTGYFRGILDGFVMRFGELISSFPDILLVILLAATLRPRIVDFVRNIEEWTGIDGIIATGAADFFVVSVALLPLSWFGMTRLVRGQVLSIRTMPYVESARAIGVSTPRLMFSHLLPNVAGPIIVTATMGIGAVAGSEIILSFLGVGVQPPHPSIGRMIADVTLQGGGPVSVLRNHPEQILVPVGIMAALIYCWNLLGDALNDVFNPRTR
jgi:ABC-type dipeptide/oligopeptide/nickel transport system permease subunit